MKTIRKVMFMGVALATCPANGSAAQGEVYHRREDNRATNHRCSHHLRRQ